MCKRKEKRREITFSDYSESPVQVYLWKCTLLVMVILLLLCSETVSEQGILWKFVHTAPPVSQRIHFICFSFRLWPLCFVIDLAAERHSNRNLYWSSKSSYSLWMCPRMCGNRDSLTQPPACAARRPLFVLAIGDQKDCIASFQWVPPAFDSNYAFQLIYAIAHINNVAVHLFCTLHWCS